MHLLKDPNVHDRCHKCRQVSPVHTLKPYFSNIHFILPARPGLPSHFLSEYPVKFCTQFQFHNVMFVPPTSRPWFRMCWKLFV